MALRCTWCSQHKSPYDLMHLSTGQLMCRRCYEWHHHALELLASGQLPPGCQECGLTMQQLNAVTNATTTRMYVVPKDGIYQVICLTCKEAYCRKRADLYRGTAFGQEIKV